MRSISVKVGKGSRLQKTNIVPVHDTQTDSQRSSLGRDSLHSPQWLHIYISKIHSVTFVHKLKCLFTLTDYYGLSISGDGQETTDGGLCLVRNDLTRQYIAGSTSSVFFTQISNKVDFNRPFCLGLWFTMLTTNASSSAPLVSITNPSSLLPVFALVVDNAGVTLTFDGSSVTFIAPPQFADGNPQQL